MKKLLLLSVIFLTLASCSGGTDAIKEISNIITTSYDKKFVVDETLANPNNHDYPNIFLYDPIKKIIEVNADYKMSKDEKSELLKAIDTYTPELTWDILPNQTYKITDEHIRTMIIQSNKTRVLESDTLGDLLK